mgnify:CR=1 FL=1
MYRIYALILCLCLVGCTQKKDIEVSTQKENFSYEEVSENFSKLQCGDIINIENSHYISNIAIPGRWKHTLIYLGSLKQVQELLDTSFPYYEKIVKMYKTQKEILVLDANVGGVQIRTFDQMANLKNESYLKAMTCFRFLKENTFIKDFLKNAFFTFSVKFSANCFINSEYNSFQFSTIITGAIKIPILYPASFNLFIASILPFNLEVPNSTLFIICSGLTLILTVTFP